MTPLPDNYVVLDVRNPHEIQATGTLENAICIPLPLLPVHIAEHIPERATPVIAFCASGGRSEMACHIMRQMGYTHLRNGHSLHTCAQLTGRRVV